MRPAASTSVPDQVQDQAVDWFLRLDQSPDDPELRRAFQLWRDQDAAHGRAYDAAQTLWSSPALDRATRATAAATPRKRRPVLRPLTIAASIAAMLVLTARIPDLLLNMRADYVTASGARQTVNLPDGSTMVLAGNSAVSTEFHNGQRHIDLLQGEVFLNVTQDPEKPFTVRSAHTLVTVLGTEFAVKEQDDHDNIILRKGRVRLDHRGHTAATAQLAPGQAITATPQGLSTARAVAVDTELAWVDGRIIFDDQPLSLATAQLQRHSGKRIWIMSDHAAKARISGNYRLDNAEAALRSMALAAGVRIQQLPGGNFVLR